MSLFSNHYSENSFTQLFQSQNEEQISKLKKENAGLKKEIAELQQQVNYTIKHFAETTERAERQEEAARELEENTRVLHLFAKRTYDNLENTRARLNESDSKESKEILCASLLQTHQNAQDVLFSSYCPNLHLGPPRLNLYSEPDKSRIQEIAGNYSVDTIEKSHISIKDIFGPDSPPANNTGW